MKKKDRDSLRRISRTSLRFVIASFVLLKIIKRDTDKDIYRISRRGFEEREIFFYKIHVSPSRRRR